MVTLEKVEKGQFSCEEFGLEVASVSVACLLWI